MITQRMWETFLPIDVDPKAEDPESSLAVLKLVRTEVAPLMRRLMLDGAIDWFSFLVHGSPVEGDARACIHLRLTVVDANYLPLRLSDRWVCTRKVPEEQLREIAGVDASVFFDGNIDRAWRLICWQSEWIINFIEAHNPKASDEAVLRQLVQFMHYFHNMTQLPESIPDWWKWMERARLGMPTLKPVTIAGEREQIARFSRVHRVLREGGFDCSSNQAAALCCRFSQAIGSWNDLGDEDLLERLKTLIAMESTS